MSPGYQGNYLQMSTFSENFHFWVKSFFKRNSLNKTYTVYKVKKQNKHCISLFQSELNFKCNIILFNPQQTSGVSLRCSDAHHAYTDFNSCSYWMTQDNLQYFTMIQIRENRVFGDLMCWTFEATFASGDYDMWCYLPRTFNHIFAVLWGVLLVYMACPTVA